MHLYIYLPYQKFLAFLLLTYNSPGVPKPIEGLQVNRFTNSTPHFQILQIFNRIWQFSKVVFLIK